LDVAREIWLGCVGGREQCREMVVVVIEFEGIGAL